MPLHAEPMPAPSARKAAPPPSTRRVQPPHKGPQRGALWHAIQLKAAQDAAAAAAAPRAKSQAGLPVALKAGVEALSGLAMDDVRVHRDSTEPARLGALAYAQGSDIHLGPGQERHLPHEAWHVVQQKQGRVMATTQMKGVAVNENPALEAEADIMGSRIAMVRPGSGPEHAALLVSNPTALRTIRQLQKEPKTAKHKEEKPSNLAEEVVGKKEYKHSQQIPAAGFDITLSFAASATFEHETLKKVAEAMTKMEVERGETAVGVDLNLRARDIRKLVMALWKKEVADKVLHPEKMSGSISTTVGGYKVETKTSPVPLTIESTVTPKDDIVFDLGKGFRAVVSAEYKIKAVRREEPRIQVQPRPSPEISPWPSIVAALLALLAFIAEYWWVPVLLI
jgi:hypothetical protein